MPELPEVETVKETLKLKIIGKKIKNIDIYYNDIIENINVDEFKEKLKNQTFIDIYRKGKWLIFKLESYYLLSHLRMEGKFNLKLTTDYLNKHEHVVFTFTDGSQLRYMDTRKFGKMHLIENLEDSETLNALGLEPWDEKLNKFYLYEKYKNKKTAIKTVLLDQNIIAGIGNIYADEILYLCKLNPQKRACDLKEKDLENIIKYTKEVLEEAILMGGTTIRTYSSSEGVHGRFQQNLKVHNRKASNCHECNTLIDKIIVNGRGTFYCPKCQK